LLFLAFGLGCPGQSKRVVYDLAARTAVAERSSSREIVLFGTPASEPHQAEGFYREAGGAGGSSFLWVTTQAEVSFTWPKVAERVAVLDMAPYGRGQSAEVSLNGHAIGRLTLNDVRYRYRLALPAGAQAVGDNRLRFVFAKTAAPSDQDPKNADKRHLSAALYSITVGDSGDLGLEDLLGRDAPQPFSVAISDQLPRLVEVGPSAVRYAIKLPPAAELRFTADLYPAARAAAGEVMFRVTLEGSSGGQREVWTRLLRATDRGSEVSVPLPGEPGSIARIGLRVDGDRFAWGTWIAPRVLGRGEGEAAARVLPEDDARADTLRKALVGSNVVFIVLDAGRAQEFGCYGYGRATTPEIDRLAKEGVVFDGVFTPAVYTLGAMSSVWTSQYPDRHHSEVSFSARLPKDRLTLAEILEPRGIATAGFVANSVAGAAFGFDRGFGHFVETHQDSQYWSHAPAFEKYVPQWLAAHKDKRFFLYMHFREPHSPYDPLPPFDTRFGPGGPITVAERASQEYFTDVNQGRRPFGTPEREHLVRLYDGNLAEADQEIGALRKRLEADGLLEHTVILVAADHGEGLFEHGWVGHNVHVYDESAHVPLVIRLPAGKGPAGTHVKGLADLLDIAPTIADIFGLRGQGGSDQKFQGRSLLPMLAGAPGKPVVLSRTVWDRPVYGLRDQQYKFIYNTRTGEEMLFDLARDPGEQRDVRADAPLQAAYYRETLHQWIAELSRREGFSGGGPSPPPLTCAQCENLKALGYFASDVKCPCS
jgi:arylsulfatase A-like enzyme